jgi:YebC/PmpR family DNA-binding regulatory protein
MYRKGAQDARKAKVFSKISREITVAVKECGSDPESNVRLRSALINARSENMPNDNIERALKKAAGNDPSMDYQFVRYEGYGPGGVAVIVEGLTDNKNRTAPEVRAAFSKLGGGLGETNSVSFQFDHVGYLRYSCAVASEEEIFEVALEVGADDIISTDGYFEITCSLECFSSLRDALVKKFSEPSEARIIWQPKNVVSISEETAKILVKLIDLLEDNDDVQYVATNACFPENYDD